MPVAQVDVTGDSLRTPTYAYLGAELGRLRTVTAFITSPGSPQPSNRVEIGIADLGDLPHSRITVLASGYLQQNSVVRWSGNIPLEKTWRVYLKLQSSDSATARLAIISSKEF